MTGMQRQEGTPTGPPWPVEMLADLHAGVLDQAVADELWPLVRADPDAREVLAALDATLDDLADFGHLSKLTPTPMPAEFAARLDAALALEVATMAAPTAPEAPVAAVVDLAAARKRRTRQVGWGAGIVAAAAAVVAVLLVVLPNSSTPGGSNVAAPPPRQTSSAAPVALGSALGPQALTVALGRSDYGPFADPKKLAACLSANGQDPNRTPAGAAQVTLGGKPGVLLVLTTGQTAQFRLLVVGADCAAGNPATLANAVVGGITGLPTPVPTK
ncbi:MAG TPA: hypothetical protein VHW44_25795 [Pseudonocardiaceae bacterium]|jgi:hypothetical protein|nr:hypothetical protein [Pseudonocardiaceae bacterium]